MVSESRLLVGVTPAFNIAGIPIGHGLGKRARLSSKAIKGLLDRAVKRGYAGKAPVLSKHLYDSLLVVLPPQTIGVRLRTMLTTRGNRTSIMAIRTTTTRTTNIGFVVCGVLNWPQWSSSGSTVRTPLLYYAA